MKKNQAKPHPRAHRAYRYWQALYLAFYSKHLYIDVAKRWKGYGLSYFLLVVALSTLPIGIKTIIAFNHYYDQQFIEPLQQLPSIDIKQGHLKFDYFMPFLIKNKQGDVVIIVDTAGQLTKINYIYPHWMLLLTADRAYFKPPKFSILPHSFSAPKAPDQAYETLLFKDTDLEYFNASLWLEDAKVSQQKWMFMSMIYPLFVAVLFGFFCGLVALMTIMGKVLSHTIFKYRLGYKEAFRMMMVSSGCGISIFIMSLGYGVRLSFMGLYLMIAMSCYFSYGILSVRRAQRQLMRSY